MTRLQRLLAQISDQLHAPNCCQQANFDCNQGRDCHLRQQTKRSVDEDLKELITANSNLTSATNTDRAGDKASNSQR